jgi:ATP diphosphatase
MTGEACTKSSPLLDAWTIQQRAAAVGFDWPNIDGVMAKLHEELNELKVALAEGHMQDAREELGDLFFSAVNLARFLQVHPDDVMHDANQKFSRRFARVEDTIKLQGRVMAECSLEELDRVWDEIKKED